jgi:hypothetical protein
MHLLRIFVAAQTLLVLLEVDVGVQDLSRRLFDERIG